MMKTIVYGPNNQPIWKDQKRPTSCGQHQVLVHVQAVGLNPVDAKGVIGDKLPHSWTRTQACARSCMVASKVIGYDFAGVVVDVGASSTFSKGDRVYGIVPPSRHGGSLQEWICVSSDQVAHIPGHVSMERAAALPLVGLTAMQCLQGAGWDNPKLQKGRLLVIGASGGTGHVAVQIGQCLQPEAQIVAVCSSRNADFCQTLATNVQIVDYRADNFVEQLQSTGPFDVVMDCVTSGDPRDQSNLDYGQLLFRKPQEFLSPDAQYRRLGGVFSDWFKAGMERTMGIKLWSNPQAKLFWIQMHQAAPALTKISGWLQDGSITLGAHVSQTVPFTPKGVEEAFEALMSRRVVGKVVVQVAAESSSAEGANGGTSSNNPCFDKKRS